MFFGRWPGAACLPPLGHRRCWYGVLLNVYIYFCVPTWRTLVGSSQIGAKFQVTFNFFVCGY